MLQLEWNERINEVLLDLKFTRNRAEYCIYSRRTEDSFVIIALYVDDLLIAGTTIKAIEEVKKGLMNSFKMKDLGKVGKFLGMNIDQNDNCNVELNLSDYTTKMLKEFGMSDCKAEKTPFYSNSSLNEVSDEQQNNENVSQYRMLVGKLLFASNTVRFDITQIVGVLSRFLQNPKVIHMETAKRVLRYLKGTMEYGIKYTCKQENSIKGFWRDADWANDKVSRRSISGYVFKYAGGPITWRSKKQAVVAISTAEAEYMSLCEAVKESLWLSNVFKDFNIELGEMIICEDNTSTIDMTKHPAFHYRSKHIDILCAFTRDHVAKGNVKIEYFPTKSQIVDMFTKTLPKPQFIKSRDLCSVVN